MFGDVIGVLTSWDDAALTVVNRAGEAVAIDRKSLVAGKTVPPAPVRRQTSAPDDPGPAELQRIAARGWPAAESEPLGDWVLRAAGGFTRRANSVQTLGDPGLPLDAALDLVQDWYARRGLAAHLEVTVPGSPEGLAEALAARGASEDETLFRTAALAPLAAAGPSASGRDAAPGPAGADVRLARTAGAGWMSRYRRVGGDPELARFAGTVIHGGPSVWFAAATLPGYGGTAAIGRCVVDGAWAGFSAVEVAPELRRRGLAGAVMAALARRAAEEGATGAYLQVEAENTGAIALYDRLGFRTSHRYHYARLGAQPR